MTNLGVGVIGALMCFVAIFITGWWGLFLLGVMMIFGPLAVHRFNALTAPKSNGIIVREIVRDQKECGCQVVECVEVRTRKGCPHERMLNTL